LNYFVSYDYREQLIDSAARELNYVFQLSKFYVPLDKLNQMQLSGNIIGSHTVSHPVIGKLSEIEHNKEIEYSFRFLESNLQLDLKTYCHPYGDFH
ncbi:MAG: polysaccharide deacetylase family protein, partial [Pseudoprimorskyibacter sp.]|nr:polysaccharide deacetylase family protein [Pseudoprimorskyibacter sp.]